MKLLEKAKELIERVKLARQRGVPIVGRSDDGAAIAVWGHWCNDNYRPGEEMLNKEASGHPLFSGRGWLYFGDRWCADTQWQIGKRSSLCMVSLSVDPGEGGVSLSLALPKIFYLHLGLDGWPKEFYQRLGIYERYEQHAIDLNFHDGMIHWRMWAPTMSWSNTTPRWRDGSVTPIDIFFGDTKMTEEIIRTKRVEIPMPEAAYPATITMSRRVWKRPRATWISHDGTYANIQVDKPGIPIPGKGTTSYNCGPDANFGISMMAKNDEEAIGYLVSNLLSRRARYGSGHRDAPRANQ